MASVAFNAGVLDGVRKGGEVYKRLTKGAPCVLAARIGPIVGAALGGLGSGLVGQSDDWFAYVMAGLVVGAFIGIQVCQYCSMPQLGKALRARGAPERQAYVVELNKDSVSWRTERLSGSASWPAVSELDRVGDDWMFLFDASGLFVPRSGFLSEADEREFVREALSLMSEEARARSPQAVAFGNHVP